MSENFKNKLWGIGAVVFIIVFAVLMFKSNLKHIEDVNGEDNYSLATITEEQIKKHDMGYLNLSTSKSMFSDDVIEFSSKKFTGVDEIFSENILMSSDYVINVTNFSIEKGNFEMVVLLDDEIVTRLEPGQDVEYHLGSVKGKVTLVIAGESAKFSFSIDANRYDIEFDE